MFAGLWDCSYGSGLVLSVTGRPPGIQAELWARRMELLFENLLRQVVSLVHLDLKQSQTCFSKKKKKKRKEKKNPNPKPNQSKYNHPPKKTHKKSKETKNGTKSRGGDMGTQGPAGLVTDRDLATRGQQELKRFAIP